MNERTRELARQSGIIQYDSDGKASEVERFAELIVRECIQNIRDNMEHVGIDTHGDKDLFLET